jgi:hypothetical protein
MVNLGQLRNCVSVRSLTLLEPGLVAFLVVGELFLGAFPSASFAQGDSGAFAIHVESNEVQIPVMVADKSYSGSIGNSKILVRGKVITELSLDDFQVFEDGVEQQVRHMVVEPYRVWGVVDNVSGHWESSCTPRGIWGGPDAPPGRASNFLDAVQGGLYVLSYPPPPSPQGSCHHVQIKVRDFNKRDVYARDQYCRIRTVSSDPLRSSVIAEKMLAYADSTQKGKFPVSAQAVSFVSNSGTHRVDIALEFPKGSLGPYEDSADPNAMISVLGLAFSKDGAIAARFSDSACYSEKYLFDFPVANLPSPEAMRYDAYMWSLTSYQNQTELTPGEYTLKLVVSDGKRFGRTEVPLTVDGYRANELAISGIALCKRFHKALEGQAKELRPSAFVPLVSQGAEFTPTGDTHFQQKDLLFTYFQIYEPLLAKTGDVNVQAEMKITNVKSGKLEVGTGLRPVDTGVQAGNPVIPVVWDLAAKKLRHGTYRLEIRASDSAGEKTPWRATTFSVE